MIWIVCLFIASLFVFLAVKTIAVKKYGRMKYALTCLFLIIGAVFLYFPYFFSRYHLINAVLSALFNVMQIISLNAQFYGVYETIPHYVTFVWVIDAYISVLALVHILLPLSAVLTAYNIIAYCMSHVRLGMKKYTADDVFVFSAYTKTAQRCALDISKKHPKRMHVIFSGKNKSEGIDSLTNPVMDCIFCDEDIDKINVAMKPKRKVYFINISDNEHENLTQTLLLIKRYSGSKMESRIHIITFINESDNDMLIDAVDKGNLHIRIIDRERVSAYMLFDKKPLYMSVNKNVISLLIVGFGNCGEELLRSAIWFGQLGLFSLKINVLTDDAERIKARLAYKYPEIMNGEYDIHFHESVFDEISIAHTIKAHCMDATYIAVTSDNDEENIRLAVYLRRFFLRNDAEYKNMPFIAARIGNNELYESVKNISTPENRDKRVGYHIYPFGNHNEIYSYNELIDSNIEKLAINVHLAYEEIFNNGNPINVAAALAKYNVFEVNKESSRANALHIKYKLFLMGLDYTDKDNAYEANFADYMTDELSELLSLAEHNRWMAFMRTEGWESATVEEAEKYKMLSGGSHKCVLLKLHTDICPFDELKQRSHALGRQDSTEIDKKLIACIPDILHDKWGATGKAYTIISL
jgi:hypothetical protein